MEKVLGSKYKEQIEVFEDLKLRVGNFISEALPWFGRGLQDIRNSRIVDEFGFWLTGIPIIGPELSNGRLGGAPNIDIAIKSECYKTPKPPEEHPVFIQLPFPVQMLLLKSYGLSIYKFIKASPELLSIPTVQVSLGQTEVLVPEPVGHVQHFALGTILNPSHTPQITPIDRFVEWYEKLKMLRDVSMQVGRSDVAEIAQEMVNLSRKRWGNQGWEWLSDSQTGS